MLQRITDQLFLFDAHYIRPHLAGCWLLVVGGRAAIIETNTTRSVPHLLEALDGIGVSRDAVDLVIVTHVHLDHAGGAGALLQALPSARLVVHPEGARHLVNPARLVAAATVVYGVERMEALYGTVIPVSPERVITPSDGDFLEIGGSPLVMLHTPGHARHHIAIHHPDSGSVFTGDVFGLGYPALATRGVPFMFPTTSPSQHDAEAMVRSISRIVDLHPRRACLTHFGAVEDVSRIASDLVELLDGWTALARSTREQFPPEERVGIVAHGIRASLVLRYRERGGELADEALESWIGMDSDISAHGLVRWADGLS